MTVEVSGYAAAQTRVSQLRAMFSDGATATATPQGGDTAAFNASLGKAIATLNAADPSVERPFIWDPTQRGAVQVKNGAAEALVRAYTNPNSPEAQAARAVAVDADLRTAANSVSRAGGLGGVNTAGLDALAGLGLDGSTEADSVLTTAKKYLGVPYKWGGTDPKEGLDCSGFVQLVYKQHGISLPRVSQQQMHAGRKVDGIENARPGDLVTFGNPATHIGIYVGDGKMIHAPRTGDVVKISPLHKNLSAIRRVLPDDAWTPAITRGGSAGLPGVGVQDAVNSLAAVGINGGVGSAFTGITASLTSPLTKAPSSYQKLFVDAEQKYGVPADLLAAVAQQESNFNPRAVSRAGARGLMQLMPGTARSLGVSNSFDPAQAVDGAARLLRDHLRTFGTVDLALAAYNAGPGAVRKHGGVPPYAETKNYVAKITRNLGMRAA